MGRCGTSRVAATLGSKGAAETLTVGRIPIFAAKCS